jgi:hypothetical protein
MTTVEQSQAQSPQPPQAYDIGRLKTALPFVKRINFEVVTDPVAATKTVGIKPDLIDDSRIIVECPDMPPTTALLIDIVCAACHQIVHPYALRQSITTNGSTRMQVRERDGMVGKSPAIAFRVAALPGLPDTESLLQSIETMMGLPEGVSVIDSTGTILDRADKPIVSDDGRTPRQPPTANLEVAVEALTDEEADALAAELDETDAAIESAIEVVK